MRQRRQRRQRNKKVNEFMQGIFALVGVGLVLLWLEDRTKFYLLAGGIMVAGVIIILLVNKFSNNRMNKLFSSGRLLKNLQAMNPYEFEKYVAELYKRLGYKTETVGGSHDGGIDIVAIDKDDVKHYIQCKKYITSKVGSPEVRDFYGAIAGKFSEGKGFFITTNIFTTEAERFAEGKPIELIDGQKLTRLINQVDGDIEVLESDLPEKKCPDCGNKLIVRTGKFGKFLGCSTYPKCRYTEGLE